MDFFSFFLPGVNVSHVYMCARLLPQSYQYPNLSEGADLIGRELCGDKDCPFSGVTNSYRVWRRVPESDAQSVMWCMNLMKVRPFIWSSVMLEADNTLLEVCPFTWNCVWMGLCRSMMALLLTASRSVTMWVGVCFLSVTAPLSTASRSVTIQVGIVQKYECDNVDVCCAEVWQHLHQLHQGVWQCVCVLYRGVTVRVCVVQRCDSSFVAMLVCVVQRYDSTFVTMCVCCAEVWWHLCDNVWVCVCVVQRYDGTFVTICVCVLCRGMMAPLSTASRSVTRVPRSCCRLSCGSSLPTETLSPTMASNVSVWVTFLSPTMTFLCDVVTYSDISAWCCHLQVTFLHGVTYKWHFYTMLSPVSDISV